MNNVDGHVEIMDEKGPASGKHRTTASRGAPVCVSAVDKDTGNTTEATALGGRIEAALLTADRPMSPAKLGAAVGNQRDVPSADELAQAIESLNRQYDSTGRCFDIEQVAGGYQVMIRPEFGPVIHALREARSETTLSKAAMETLAIVAYRQPVIRADIEAIRGVACGEILRNLLDVHLVKIVGRAEEIGRPMLYGTGREFLTAFGLASIKDLPSAKELKAP